ncbi:MAG TPA: nuclear transport factor 2 family protein [Mycobacterium sp.]|nr:nuclear transport factor 2 family protein [Mycobacterium sp.]
MTDTQTTTENLAHAAGRRSREAVIARDKQAWLDVFADEAVLEDPIGPSPFDPEGKGHRGKEAIAAFWDKAIAPTDRIEFHFVDTFQCGNEEANVGSIVITMGGHQITTEGVFTYKADGEGRLLALRAYWQLERAAATARPV